MVDFGSRKKAIGVWIINGLSYGRLIPQARATLKRVADTGASQAAASHPAGAGYVEASRWRSLATSIGCLIPQARATLKLEQQLKHLLRKSLIPQARATLKHIKITGKPEVRRVSSRRRGLR